jgi:hypothetical protein
LPLKQIRAIDRGGRNSDHQLARAGFGVGQIHNLKNLWSPGLGSNHGTHEDDVIAASTVRAYGAAAGIG